MKFLYIAVAIITSAVTLYFSGAATAGFLGFWSSLGRSEQAIFKGILLAVALSLLVFSSFKRRKAERQE